MSSSSSSNASFWCYRCSRFVRLSPHGSVSCPDCSGGFLEQLSTPPRLAVSAADHRRRFPSSSSAAASASASSSSSDSARRRYRRGLAGDLSPFNPVIVLRGASEIEPDRPTNTANNRTSFEFFYDDGTGSGLRPLPSTVSDFLMGSGFDRLLGQLAQIETNAGACDHPPASKAAVESMPTINIDLSHVGTDSYCAVCKERFELGAEAREMPCKHIYHQDCILPWLSLRNSCPVCRHELPADVRRGNSEEENEDESVGLTIWRLPGGGFAVGRFAGGRRPGERDLPVVYTEMDGGFNSGSGAPRRISWPARGSRSRESGGGFVRTLRNLFSFRCFGGSSGSSALSAGASASRSLSTSSTMQNRGAPMLRRRRDSRRDSNSWALEDGSGNSISRW